MKLVNKINGGTVEVSEEYAEKLLASGDYTKPKSARASKPKTPRAPKPEATDKEE